VHARATGKPRATGAARKAEPLSADPLAATAPAAPAATALVVVLVMTVVFVPPPALAVVRRLETTGVVTPPV
jgi:hypothetical protein